MCCPAPLPPRSEIIMSMGVAGVSPRDSDGGGDVGGGVGVGDICRSENMGIKVPDTRASVVARRPRPRPRVLRCCPPPTLPCKLAKASQFKIVSYKVIVNSPIRELSCPELACHLAFIGFNLAVCWFHGTLTVSMRPAKQ